MRSPLNLLQASLPGITIRLNQFRQHKLAMPQLAGLYLFDAHSSQGVSFRTQAFPLRKKRKEFPYVGSPQYGNMDNSGKKCTGLYSKKGWNDSGRLPLTGFKPLIDIGEAEKLRQDISEKIKDQKHSAYFGIEATDCILSTDDARWLVSITKEHKAYLKAQLTYNHQNHLATGCRVWIESEQGYCAKIGLSGLGKELTQILMQGGIIIDASHLNKQSLLDACEIGRRVHKPVIASHSNTLNVFSQGNDQTELKATNRFAVRCLDDEEIYSVLSTGGYIGITASPWFLSDQTSKWAENIWRAKENGLHSKKEPDGTSLRKQTVMLLVSHINHVRRIARESDFETRNSSALASDVEKMADGTLLVPPGYSQRSYTGIFSGLAKELVREGWQEEGIAALFHGNVERIFH